MMFVFTLVALVLCYMGVIGFFVYADGRVNKDKLSAVKMVSYFAVLESLVMGWFAFNQDSLFNLVLNEVDRSLVSEENIVIAYLFSIVAYLLTVLGAFFFSYTNRVPLKVGSLLPGVGNIRFGNLAIPYLLFAIGLIVYGAFIVQVGGFVELFANMATRTKFLIGKGGYIIVFGYLILISGLLISTRYLKTRGYFMFFVIFVVVVMIEASSGSRWNVALYVFSLFVLYHYAIRKYESIVNWRVVALSFSVVALLMFSVMYRVGENSVGVGSFVEENLIKRYGVIERQVTIIGYFGDHDFWQGMNYGSLFEVFQSRADNSDKQPIDSGVYLRALANGQQVTPPLSANSLPATSWPERNLAGYMNFGVVGLVCLSFISGSLIGISYRLLMRYGAIGYAMLYSFFVFMGGVDLSPFGVFGIVKIVAFLVFVGLVYALYDSAGRFLRFAIAR